MELEEFVRRTIVQVISGVRLAGEEAHKAGASLGHGDGSDAIEIDVAVTATSSTSAGGGGGITVCGIGAKAEAKSDAAESTVSRVKFKVPICYPTAGPDPRGLQYG